MKTVDQMFVIFPFEKKWYKDHFNYSVDFVGHPLLDAIEDRKINPTKLKQELGLSKKPTILLMPGSRSREIQSMLPIMGEITHHYPDYEFVIAGAPSQEESFYRKFISDDVKFVSNKTYDLLSIAHVALVTSGTATLETALFKVPEIICYKGDPISWWIAKNFLVKLDFIGIVNLIMEKEIAKELLQNEMNAKNLRHELDVLLSGEGRAEMLENYKKLHLKLGGKGASKRLADKILNQLNLD